MSRKKDGKPSSVKQKIIINGEEKVFTLSIAYKKDPKTGRFQKDRFGNYIVDNYFYRPTELQKWENPRLTKNLRKKSLAKMITAIQDLYEVDNPDRESKQFFNDGIKQWMIDVKKTAQDL